MPTKRSMMLPFLPTYARTHARTSEMLDIAVPAWVRHHALSKRDGCIHGQLKAGMHAPTPTPTLTCNFTVTYRKTYQVWPGS